MYIDWTELVKLMDEKGVTYKDLVKGVCEIRGTTYHRQHPPQYRDKMEKGERFGLPRLSAMAKVLGCELYLVFIDKETKKTYKIKL